MVVTDSAPAPAAKTAIPWRRISMILLVGLATLNVVQYGAGRLAERAYAAEKAEALAPQATIDRFHTLFYKDRGTLDSNRWMGVLAGQNPNDVWITQEILVEVKPDFVVEMGSYRGGSAVLWAMILREVNPMGRVITVDIKDQITDAKKLPTFQERVDFLVGDSVAPAIVAEVKRRVAGRKVVLILDSDHHKDHVLKELQAYWDVVQPGSYVIVQDSNINGHPVQLDEMDCYRGKEGPMEAIQAFMATNHHFRIDRSRERLLLTMNPNGFLRRVD